MRCRRYGQQALRAHDHHEDEQEAEDAEAPVGKLEVQAELARHAVEHVGISRLLISDSNDRPEHHPQIEPRPPR